MTILHKVWGVTAGQQACVLPVPCTEIVVSTQNKMERNWEERGLSPFLCPSTAPFSQIIHTHFHLPFTLYDVLMVCYFYDFSEDEQFNDEKTYLIKQIKEL